jgi:hypothetical protein
MKQSAARRFHNRIDHLDLFRLDLAGHGDFLFPVYFVASERAVGFLDVPFE